MEFPGNVHVLIFGVKHVDGAVAEGVVHEAVSPASSGKFLIIVEVETVLADSVQLLIQDGVENSLARGIKRHPLLHRHEP